MLVQCPNCLRRYRLNPSRAKLLRVRCKGCGNEFLVSPSQDLRHDLAGNSGRTTTVVADIQRDFRNFLLQLLISQGFHIVVAEDGDTAYTVVREQKPRLLLVNPYLPGLMGTDLIARLRSEGHSPPTVILLGAIHNSRRYRRRPESLYGADDYLDEGTDDTAILRKLEFHLDLSLSHQQPETHAEDDGVRLARSVFADMLVYDPERMARVRSVDEFFRLFAEEAAEGRRYIESRKPGAGRLLRDVVTRYLARA